ncbi:GNAT family N-acetyltransferase [Planifilum fimeticola]
MNVRLLDPEDAVSFRELRLRALRDHPDAFGKSYEEAVNLSVEETAERLKPSPDAFVLGAFDAAGKLVGMVGFYREKGMKKRHKGVIWGMYCLPECRGKGVGKALLAEAVERARKMKGLELITLRVVASNDSAKKLYLSAGFRTWGKEPRSLKIGSRYMDQELMVFDFG